MKLFEYPELGERFWESVTESGLRLRVVPRPGFARAYAMLVVNYGSVDARTLVDGELFTVPQGTAHFLEHKMFDMPDMDVMEAFTRTGANPNAFTGYAMTAYYFDCTDAFGENLALLLRYVTTPWFSQESVEKELGIIGQEIGMYSDSPGARLSENLQAAMYACHPLREPILGTEATIAEITPEVLNRTHQAFYHPSNLLLLVVGDVDPEAVERIAAREIPVTPVPRTERLPVEEPLTVPTHRVEQRMEVSMPMFAVGFKCAPSADPADNLRLSLLGSLAADVLAGESSALYTRLYTDGLIDAGFSAAFLSLTGAAMLAFSGDSCDPDAVVEALYEEKERLLREGIDPIRFRRLKRAAEGERLRELDSFETLCCAMAECLADGQEYHRFPELSRELTEQDVLDLLAECVRPERCVLSLILPEDTESEEAEDVR